jgi:hypothetical protein
VRSPTTRRDRIRALPAPEDPRPLLTPLESSTKAPCLPARPPWSARSPSNGPREPNPQTSHFPASWNQSRSFSNDPAPGNQTAPEASSINLTALLYLSSASPTPSGPPDPRALSGAAASIDPRLLKGFANLRLRSARRSANGGGKSCSIVRSTRCWVRATQSWREI